MHEAGAESPNEAISAAEKLRAFRVRLAEKIEREEDKKEESANVRY